MPRSAAELRSFSITLPMPAAVLRPNARPHWSTRMKAVRQARHDASHKSTVQILVQEVR